MAVPCYYDSTINIVVTITITISSQKSCGTVLSSQFWPSHSIGCSPSRMPLRGWSLAQVDVNISHPFYENYTGCQSDAVSSSRPPHWCSRHGTAWHLHIWSTIATWSAMTFDDYVQLSPSCVHYQGQGQGSVIDHSQSPNTENYPEMSLTRSPYMSSRISSLIIRAYKKTNCKTNNIQAVCFTLH